MKINAHRQTQKSFYKTLRDRFICFNSKFDAKCLASHGRPHISQNFCEMFSFVFRYSFASFVQKTMIIMCLLIALFILTSGQFLCPQTSWKRYKYQSIPIDSLAPQHRVTFSRIIDYNCTEENFIALKTRYYYLISWEGWRNWACIAPVKMQCSGRCSSKNVSTRIKCDSWKSDIGYDYQRIKNCDILFWTRWSLTLNCSSLRSSSYTRSCVDCDYNVVGSQYCVGNATKNEECLPSWNTTSGGSSSNALIGLSVGIALALAIIVGLCIFMYLKGHLQRKSKTVGSEACNPSNNSTIPNLKLTSLPGSSVEEIYSNAQDHVTADATYSTLNHK